MADKSMKTTVACKLPNGLTIAHRGHTVTLAGANDDGNRFGFGLTENVEADWFRDWITTDGKDLDAVKSGAIFEHGSKTADAAKERQNDPDVQTGQEPLNPSNPGLGVEPTDETKKVLSGSDGGVNSEELKTLDGRAKA